MKNKTLNLALAALTMTLATSAQADFEMRSRVGALPASAEAPALSGLPGITSASLIFHLDPAESQIYSDTAKTVPVTEGGYVRAITPNVGLSLTAASDITTGITYTAASTSGLPALNFGGDAGSKLLTSSNLLSEESGRSIFAVTSGGGSLLQFGGAALPNYVIQHSGGYIYTDSSNAAFNASTAIASTALPTDSVVNYTNYSYPTAFRFFYNSVEQSVTQFTRDVHKTTSGTPGFILGARSPYDSGWSGVVSELIIYEGDISDADRTLITDYLINKHNP